MAALSFRYGRRELNPSVESISALKNVIFHSVLRRKGFTNVVNTGSEVAGDRSGARVSILHLDIGGGQFWRVVMGVSDAGSDQAKTAVDEVFKAIDELKFL